MTSDEGKGFFRACPDCGGEVHMVASRCKHCGADLRDRPAAEPEPAPEPAPAAAGPADPAPEPAPAPAVPESAPAARAPARPRWMWLGAAALLVAIGMALGILIERADRDDRRASERPVAARRGAATPRAIVPPPQLDPDLDHFTPLPGGGGFSFRITPFSHRSRGPAGDGPEVDEFVRRLGDELCAKLSDCADVDPAIGILCRTIAGGVDTGDIAAKVDAGECSYDQAAAASCIDGLSSIDCDADQQDPFAMLLTVESIMSCVEAVRCPAW